MKKFVQFKRAGDSGEMRIVVEDICMICDNSNETGIVEGTTGVYLGNGLAMAVQGSPGEVEEAIHAALAVQ